MLDIQRQISEKFLFQEIHNNKIAKEEYIPNVSIFRLQYCDQHHILFIRPWLGRVAEVAESWPTDHWAGHMGRGHAHSRGARARKTTVEPGYRACDL